MVGQEPALFGQDPARVGQESAHFVQDPAYVRQDPSYSIKMTGPGCGPFLIQILPKIKARPKSQCQWCGSGISCLDLGSEMEKIQIQDPALTSWFIFRELNLCVGLKLLNSLLRIRLKI